MGGNNNNTYLANQLSAIQSQAVTNGVANQQAVSNASQYVTEAVNSNGRDTTQAINNGTIANVQGQGDTKLTIAGLGANLSQAIMGLGANLAQAIAGVNQNISNQGYESRIQAQQLTGMLTAQHAELLKTISDENCKDRELMRQIQTEAIAGALGITVSGSSLYASYILNGDVINAYITESAVSLTGTWVYLGAGFKTGAGQDKLTGIWKRIA